MPGGDGTGPMGMGQMTGRAAGYCAGNQTPGYASAPGGGGRMFAGGGRGGRGWRNRYYATGMTGRQQVAAQAVPEAPAAAGNEQELGALRQQVEIMEQQINRLREQMEKREAEA